LDKLKSQKNARIILVSSEGHRFAAWGLPIDDLNWEKHRYYGLKSYGSAKTAQLLSMLKFRDIFAGSGITINAMHPGNVKTNMGSQNKGLYKLTKRLLVDATAKSPEISAEALYYLGVDKKVEGITGKFFNLTTQEIPAPPALDEEVADKLWDLSLELGGMQI
jgi:NAD(P)-dependent dehydrogenase (short-subunit alcohol dehydrogenase family)